MSEWQREKDCLFSRMPATTPDYMAAAWLGALRWAVANKDCRAAFEAETGERLPQTPRSGLEAAIDQAVGRNTAAEMDHYLAKFIDWFNGAVWGDVSTAPPSAVNAR